MGVILPSENVPEDLREYFEPVDGTLKNVWAINPGNFPGSHFAVFPPELPEICIKAGTSERGVCPSCKSPWQRGVEKTGNKVCSPDAYGRERTFQCEGQIQEKGGGRGSQGFFTNETIDLGWRPTCDCPGPDGDHPGSDCADYDEWPTEPAVVLDCFAGSGATGEVCEKLHRDSILIELAEHYLPLIERRTAQPSML